MPNRVIQAFRIAVIAVIPLVAAGPAAAQGMKGVSFEAGYQFAHVSQGGFGETFPAGFVVDVLHELKRLPSGRLDVTGGLGLSFGSAEVGESDRVLTAMGGVRWTRPLQHGRAFFLEGEAGLGRTSASFSANSSVGVGGDSENAFAFQIGAGYALPLGKRSPDLRRAFTQDLTHPQVPQQVSDHDHGLGLMFWFIFRVIADPSAAGKEVAAGVSLHVGGK